MTNNRLKNLNYGFRPDETETIVMSEFDASAEPVETDLQVFGKAE